MSRVLGETSRPTRRVDPVAFSRVRENRFTAAPRYRISRQERLVGGCSIRTSPPGSRIVGAGEEVGEGGPLGQDHLVRPDAILAPIASRSGTYPSLSGPFSGISSGRSGRSAVSHPRIPLLARLVAGPACLLAQSCKRCASSHSILVSCVASQEEDRGLQQDGWRNRSGRARVGREGVQTIPVPPR